MKTTDTSVTLLVYAWDPYYAAWPVFCYAMKKYWQDCPYPLVFITNFLDPPCGDSIKIGHINCFYDKLCLALERITTPYVIFMHEDYWIQSHVTTQNIIDYIGLLEIDVCDYIRLIPVPPPDRDFPLDTRLGIVSQNSEYRISFMTSLWRVAVLREILQPHLNLWEHEKYGPQLAYKYGDRFLAVKRREFGIDHIVTAIHARRWTAQAYEYAQRENIYVEFDKLIPPPLHQRILHDIRMTAYRLKRRVMNRRHVNL